MIRFPGLVELGDARLDRCGVDDDDRVSEGHVRLWLAHGEKPIPDNTFRGYNLNELFGNDPAAVAEPALVE